MTDYVQLTEDILGPDDDYWKVDQACWDPSLAPGLPRQDACARTFGAAADQNTQRDFPILEAYDDHVVLGRFYTTPEKTREVVYKDPSNAPYLKLMQCCFHNQVRFKVRTGQLWSAVGQAVGGGPGVGFFSHLTTDSAGRCVPSCDPREALLNGRVPTNPNRCRRRPVDDPAQQCARVAQPDVLHDDPRRHGHRRDRARHAVHVLDARPVPRARHRASPEARSR